MKVRLTSIRKYRLAEYHVEDIISLKHSINGPPERRVKQTDHHRDGQAG